VPGGTATTSALEPAISVLIGGGGASALAGVLMAARFRRQACLARIPPRSTSDLLSANSPSPQTKTQLVAGGS
jgi:hypothetical protein